VDYRVRSDGSFLTVGYTRSKFGPWPLAGGVGGSTNYVEVLRKGGGCERHSIVTALRINEGDVIRVVTANGAGYGDPSERDPEAVRDDIRNGYITAERAKELYGIET
jgi:N-methylhydantoinase B